MIAQTEQQKVGLAMIEELRKRKETLKSSRQKIDNEIIEVDIQIRNLRQSLPKMAEPEKPVKTQKPKETLIQKHNRLLREIAEVESKLGANI